MNCTWLPLKIINYISGNLVVFRIGLTGTPSRSIGSDEHKERCRIVQVLQFDKWILSIGKVRTVLNFVYVYSKWKWKVLILTVWDFSWRSENEGEIGKVLSNFFFLHQMATGSWTLAQNVIKHKLHSFSLGCAQLEFFMLFFCPWWWH